MYRSPSSTLLLLSFLVSAGAVGLCQNGKLKNSAVVKGSVTEEILCTPVPGTAVKIIGSDGNILTSTISGQDGSYRAGSRGRGETVTLHVSKTGYRPDPRQITDILLADTETIRDVTLYVVTDNTAYLLQASELTRTQLALGKAKEALNSLASKSSIFRKSYSQLNAVYEQFNSPSRCGEAIESTRKKMQAAGDLVQKPLASSRLPADVSREEVQKVIDLIDAAEEEMRKVQH